MNKEKKKQNKKAANVVPVFYASDVNYLPYLSVSLLSLKKNANRKNNYKIYILHTGIDTYSMKPIIALNESGFDIEFIDVKNRLQKIKHELQLRDYYTGATYYRVFIANMFPQYDKAVYLDSDTVILGDISKFFNYNLKDNFVGYSILS